MKRKGFTLIELLAVIVILSVITLITVPMITSVIEESKKKALVSSVQGLIESANLYAIENEGVHEFLFDREHQGSTQNGESLDYKGKIEGEGKLYIDKEGNTSVCISNDTYYVYKNYNSEIIIGERSKDNCNIEYDALTNKYVAFLESTGSESNVYSKDEVNNLVDSLDTKITNNINEISNIKSNLNDLSSVVSSNNEDINNLSSQLDDLNKPILLWQNENPTSAFTEQKITLLTDDYDYIKIFYRQHHIGDGYCSCQTVLKGFSTRLVYNTYGSVVITGIRDIKYLDDITFQVQNESAINISADQNWLVPIKIYGYKF